MSEDRLLIGLAGFVADPSDVVRQVEFAERNGLNFAVFDDGPGAPGRAARGGLDPIEAAAYAGAITSSIGLIATAPVTHAEPYHLSNRFSSLDWGSSGRAGWLATVDSSPARARAYATSAPSPEVAAREAAAVLNAAAALWDSWEDGALIADSARGRFLDQDKLHYVDVAGEFSIRGPALMPRPIQGQVVVLGRDGDDGIDPDVLIIRGLNAADLVRAADRARTSGSAVVFAEIMTNPGTDLLTLLRAVAGHLDGVVLRPAKHMNELDELARTVVPALITDGTLIPPHRGQTLREQLGLARPENRYAITRGQS